jgi:hypothetical protein
MGSEIDRYRFCSSGAQAAHEVTPEHEAWYLVKNRCYLCHFIDQQDIRWGAKWGPSLKGLFSKPNGNLISGNPINEHTVSDWINEGGPNMPAFSKHLMQEKLI